MPRSKADSGGYSLSDYSLQTAATMLNTLTGIYKETCCWQAGNLGMFRHFLKGARVY